MFNNKSFNCTFTAKDSNITPHDGLMWFLLFGFPFVAVLGIIGNIFSFVILKESALKNVGHFYLFCLSVFDSFTLLTILTSFYNKIVLYPILVRMNIYSPFMYTLLNGYTGCTFRMYATFTMRLISIWTIVIFSLDRLIAISFPMKSQKISTVKNSIFIIAGLVVTSFLVNIPWILGYDKKYNPCFKTMTCKSNRIHTVMLMVESIFLSIIPSLLICFCNVTIIVIIKKRQSHSTLINKKEALNQEKMITFQLLLVSTAFIILTLPSFIITSINFENKARNDFSYKKGHKANALHIGIFLFSLNLSINFLLYCLTGPNFRRAAWSILHCRYEEMRFYRRIILNPNVTTDANMSELTDANCRSGSVSSEKNNLLISSKISSALEKTKEKLNLSTSPPKTPLAKYTLETPI